MGPDELLEGGRRTGVTVTAERVPDRVKVILTAAPPPAPEGGEFCLTSCAVRPAAERL